MKRSILMMVLSLFCVAMSANIAETEPNNDFQHAQAIEVNTPVNGTLGVVTNDVLDAYDWYRIEVPSDGTLDICTTSETALRLDWLDFGTVKDDAFTRRNQKDMDAHGVDSTVVFNIPDVAKGTYYVKVKHYQGQGKYVLNCKFTPNPYANDEEPNDEFGQAKFIACNKDVQGHLGYYYADSFVDLDAYDWYRIEIPANGVLDICTTTETSLRLDWMEFGTVKDGEFTRRNQQDMDGFGADTTVVFTIPDVAKGTYYVKVKHYRGQGGYILNCKFTPNPYANDEEPNDVVKQAQSIGCGQDIQGQLGYFSIASYTDLDAYDWYCVELPADGTLDIRTTTETSLRLEWMEFGMLTDGTFVRRDQKDMDAYGVDTTIVLNIPDVAKGTYYLRVKHYRGQGGYILNCAFTPNPYYTNDIIYTEESPCKLVQNKTDYTTLGYTRGYNEGRMEQWYTFSTSEPTTLEIQPDTLKSLVIGVVEIWKKGEDGAYNNRIYCERLERTYRSFDISEPGDYLVRVPRYLGCGGISVRYGDDESGMLVPGSVIRVSVEGRNTVRKGVPCQNTVVVRNTCDKKTGSFLLAMAATDDIKIIKINLSDIHGRYGEDMMYEDICNSDSSVVLYIPSLAPFEEYRILVTSEGVGDIAYAKGHGPKEVVATTLLVTAAIGFVVDACVEAGSDWIKGGVKEYAQDMIMSRNEEDALNNVVGITRQQADEMKYHGDGYGTCVAKKMVENVMQGVMKAVPGGSVAMKIGEKASEAADIITCMRRKLWYWIYKDIGLIKEDDNTHMYDAKVGVNGVVASWDPNEMVGPQGVGDEHYLGDVKTINYTIMFENKAEAGAPAYRVRVSDELDPDIFDVNSVRFGATSHDGMGYNWKMSRDGNKLAWDIEGIELPPNKVAPEGEGYVTFSVNLKPGLADGTLISNKATIIFDKNTPIETNVFINVLDLEAPATTMLSAEKSVDGIVVKCQSDDTKSGVGTYALYVSKDNQAYELAGFYPDEEILYTPDGDGEYNFYVQAVDNVGNTETEVPNTVNITVDVKQIMDNSNPADGIIYDLAGRKVQNPGRGIYIQNNRKILK